MIVSRTSWGMMRRAWLLAAVLFASCSSPEPRPLPPNSFAFAVFGDGPYHRGELGRFARVIDDVNRADVEWFLHVGDILWTRCSDSSLARTLRELNTIRHPVVYTPGDNEWTDCHRGAFQPLDRLQRIRSMYFADPSRSIAGPAMQVAAALDWLDSAFAIAKADSVCGVVIAIHGTRISSTRGTIRTHPFWRRWSGTRVRSRDKCC